ncbi:RidA family protein [Parvularcula marina]|uniref:RidA family protein n=1 Tax=Parvularcula marina TaxID=2292771 RepID=A0A371RJU0_9PROT|nr:RidA family protein [Parvularcula marina]RFB05717.1 RidA family protein [Parvularcula marina]
MSIIARLEELGLELPQPAAPVASYVPTQIVGELLYISGQVSMTDGQIIKGCLGGSPAAGITALSLEEGIAAARACGIMLLAQARAALEGDLDRVASCVRLGGFVASTADFFDHPKVINGASDLMLDVMGDAGKHTRAAVGVPSLPLGAAVEIDGIFRIR